MSTFDRPRDGSNGGGDDSPRPKLSAKAGNLLAGRERPLFTNRRSHNAYEEPRFMTDSLNTSFAPSPSPARPHQQQHQQSHSGSSAIPRLAALPANGRSKTTWVQKENAKPTSSPDRLLSTERYSRLRGAANNDSGLRSSPQRSASSQRSPTSNRKKSATPSPSRGRRDLPLVSPLSNPSESSPPRELGESYRRIKDEEALAGQQGSGSEGSVGGEYRDAILRDIVNGEMPEHLRSPTPSSRRSSRRFSPSAMAEEQAQENVAPRELQGSTGSGNSSPFDEVTQEELQERDSDVQKKPPTEREKRKARTKAMINGPPLFSKARPLRTSLLPDDSKKDGGSSHSGKSSYDSHSASSRVSDPSLGSLNIPANWGRKARRVGPWLDRIGETALNAPAATKPGYQPEEPMQENKADADKAEAVAEWVENSAAEANNTLDSDSFRPDETEDVALTGQQLAFAVSEAQKTEDAAAARSKWSSARPWVSELDAIRERERAPELEELERRSLTTNMLGELKEKRSLDSVGRRSTNDSSNTKDVTQDQNGYALASPASDEQPRLNFIATTLEEPDSFLNDNESTEEPSAKAKSARPVGVLDETRNKHGNNQRPRDERHDSWEVLRALSRAESKSPSPASERRIKLQTEEEQGPSRLSNSVYSGSASTKRPEKPVMPKPVLPENSQPSQDLPIETPRQAESKVAAKTPWIMGGWINTPATKQKPTPPPETVRASTEYTVEQATRTQTQPPAKPSTKSAEELDSTAPKLKTALEEILDKAKSDKAKRDQGEDVDSTVLLDDSTLQSLEDLLTDPESSERIASMSVDPSEAARDTLERAARLASEKRTAERRDAKARDATDSRLRDGSEASGPASKAYQSLVTRLTHLRQHISDSRDGMTALQRQLSKRPSPKQSSSRKARKTPEEFDIDNDNGDDGDDQECHEAGELHDFILVCPKCGSGGDPSWLQRDDPTSLIAWQPLQVPMPGLLWTWGRDAALPGPTARGWIALLLLALWGLNYAVDSAYTPPFYATSMQGFGVDYHVPRPPFVAAQLAWRNVLDPLLSPLWFGVCVGLRFLAAMCGIDPWLFDGLGEWWRDGAAAAAAAAASVAAGAGSAAGSAAEGAAEMGFGADELL